MIRIGIAGAGRNATGHVKGLLDVPGARVTSVYDIDQERAAELADLCGATVSVSLDDLLAGTDAVFVCSWTGAHGAAVEAAAQAGRAIFCEKPLAPTAGEAQAMVDTVRRHGVLNQVGLPLRWLPGYAVLRAMLAEANEKVLSVTMHTQMGNREKAEAGWRRDVALAGGGVLLEVGFHDLDLLQWVVGPVASCKAVITPGQYAGIEDAASVALSYESGAVGALVISWHLRKTEEVPARELRIVCDHSQYVLEGHTRLRRFGPGPDSLELGEEELEERAARLGLSTDPHEGFVRLVSGGGGTVPTFDDAMRVHTLLDSAYATTDRDGGPALAAASR